MRKTSSPAAFVPTNPVLQSLLNPPKCGFFIAFIHSELAKFWLLIVEEKPFPDHGRMKEVRAASKTCFYQHHEMM
jgi:hypothetical protein